MVQFVSVCIFCFLCHCAIHAELTTHSSHAHNDIKSTHHPSNYLNELLHEFGDGQRLSADGFERIVSRLKSCVQHDNDESTSTHHHQESTSEMSTNCHNVSHTQVYDNMRQTLVYANASNQSAALLNSCPILLASVLLPSKEDEACAEEAASSLEHAKTYHAWLYSMLAITIISACGILGLAVIPVMQKRFYTPLLQFLVALAVGTLAGDALLHLLPHAMMAPHDEHANQHAHHAHDQNMWKGVVAMLGLILFFFVERFIMLVTKWRKRKQQHEELLTRLKVIKAESSGQRSNMTDQQCMHKYSSFPYCYKDIHKEMDQTQMNLEANGIVETNQNLTECPDDANKTNCSEVNKMLPSNTDSAPLEEHNHQHKDGVRGNGVDDDGFEYTVILREHESRHHGHSHTHGHVHAPPKNITSVAWMVIMGDGLHNFTDGMAIGAAFASSTAGGFSTAVAVFCHELPHELGDFAMLLKAGMSMKQALYYNLLSSVLCLFGNIFGLWLGTTEAASAWIFAAAAGMFLYIALVDMIPELSSGHEDDGGFMQCVLHLLGLLLGFLIMALIAMYEHDLKSIFHED